MYKYAEYAILRGNEVLLHGIKDYEQAVRLADELAHTNSQALVLVEVLGIIDGRLRCPTSS